MEEVSKSKRLDVVLALLIFIPVALVFQQSATSLTEQGASTGDAMTNAALFPKIVAILLGVLAAWQLVVAVRRPSVDETINWSRKTIASIAVMALLIAYISIVGSLGYHLATPLLCAAVLLLLSAKLTVSIITGIAMSLTVAIFFESVLNVVLPVGFFGLSLPF